MEGFANELATNAMTRSGARISLPQAYCRVCEKRLNVRFLERAKKALEEAPLPPDTEVLLRRRTDSTGEGGRPPAGLLDLAAEPNRELIPPSTTEAAIRRLRLRLEHAATVFRRYGLEQVTSLRLHALFHGPPGTGKTSAFRVITEGLADKTYSLSLRALVGSHLGDTERNLSEVTEFVLAHSARQGSLALLIDDADDFCGARGDDTSAAGQTELPPD